MLWTLIACSFVKEKKKSEKVSLFDHLVCTADPHPAPPLGHLVALHAPVTKSTVSLTRATDSTRLVICTDLLSGYYCRQAETRPAETLPPLLQQGPTAVREHMNNKINGHSVCPHLTCAEQRNRLFRYQTQTLSFLFLHFSLLLRGPRGGRGGAPERGYQISGNLRPNE